MYEISWHSFGPADAIFAFVQTRGTRDLHRLTNVPTAHTPTRVSLNYTFYCKIIIIKLNNEDRRNERQRDCIISDDIINRLRYEEQSKQKEKRKQRVIARYIYIPWPTALYSFSFWFSSGKNLENFFIIAAKRKFRTFHRSLLQVLAGEWNLICGSPFFPFFLSFHRSLQKRRGWNARLD